MTKAAELAKMGEVLTNSQIGGRRNIAINGAMNVAQRSASVTGIGASSGYFTVDRFNILTGNSAGRLTMTQTADGPSGFANCIKLDCTTADTSIAAGEFLILEQKFEGQDLQQLKKGTSSAEKVTVSFYAKQNAERDLVLSLFDVDNDRNIAKVVTIGTGWARHTVTFDGDTTGALGDDNANSLTLRWFLHAGSTYTGASLSTSWAANANNNLGAGIESFYGSTDNTFFITGVQLEIGSQATPFEHRSFGEELALCQRYLYYQEAGNAFQRFAAGFMSTATVCEGYVETPVTMRAAPALITTGTVANYAVYVNNAVVQCSALTFQRSSGTVIQINGTISSNTTARGAVIMANNNDAVFLSYDAEL